MSPSLPFTHNAEPLAVRLVLSDPSPQWIRLSLNLSQSVPLSKNISGYGRSVCGREREIFQAIDDGKDLIHSLDVL